MKVFKAPKTQSYVAACHSQVLIPDCTFELPAELLKEISVCCILEHTDLVEFRLDPSISMYFKNSQVILICKQG